MAVAVIIMLSSCGASHYLTTNANLQQTNVVLSHNNFLVVKNVESSVTAKYYLLKSHIYYQDEKIRTVLYDNSHKHSKLWSGVAILKVS